MQIVGDILIAIRREAQYWVEHSTGYGRIYLIYYLLLTRITVNDFYQ